MVSSQIRPRALLSAALLATLQRAQLRVIADDV
jgi:hypothetical protein